MRLLRHAQGYGSRAAAAGGVDAPAAVGYAVAAVCRHAVSSVINSGCWWYHGGE